jgi:hypothetical protein
VASLREVQFCILILSVDDKKMKRRRIISAMFFSSLSFQLLSFSSLSFQLLNFSASRLSSFSALTGKVN